MILNSSFSPNSRRGISSVVGALIFTVLMIAGFSAMSLALDSQTDIVNTQRVVADIELKKQQEQFGIAVFTDANNILNVSVDNNGQNPVEISRVWITNKTLATQPAKPFSINSDDAFVPTGFTSNILSSQPLYMIPDTYDVKVISTLGTVKITEVTVGSASSSGGLRAELITDPPDVIIGQNVTVAMVVTNTGSSTIEDVTPNSPTVTPLVAVVASSLPIPTSVDLTPGESVLFSWDYTISGASGDDVTFSSYASGIDIEDSNTVTSNTVSDVSTLRLPSDGGNGDPNLEELIVLTQDLLAKPAIFTIIPGPFGDDDQKALWGVNIVNPTAQDLYVNKIVLSAISTQGTGSDVIINAGSCGPVNIPGTPTGTWECPANNQLMWKNLANPALVSGYSSVSFLVRITPGAISGGPSASLETIPVTANVFTTLGQFGKAGYATSLDNSGVSLANVYLTDNPGSTSDSDILSSISGITSGSTVRLNATLADFDTGSSQFIDDGSRLIINIPKGWTNPTIINAPGFTVVSPIQTYSDGSSQIVGLLQSDLTGSGGIAKTIQFEVTAPIVTTTQLYVMYILADGTITNGFTALGPLSEVVLQVIP